MAKQYKLITFHKLVSHVWKQISEDKSEKKHSHYEAQFLEL